MRGKLPLIALFAAAGAALLLAGDMARGISEGLSLAAGVFIPATLPFCFICAFAAFSPLGARLKSPAALPLLLGLAGGYTACVIAAKRMCDDGTLSEEAARRLCLFCVLPGPAFAVSAVGQRLLGSGGAGVIIWVSLLGGAWLNSLFCKKEPRQTGQIRPQRGWAQALALSVGDAATCCLYAAAAIAVSCGTAEALLRAAGKLGLANEYFSAAFYALFEVTRGSAALASLPGFFTVAAVTAALGFGGLGVLAQLCAFCGRLCRPAKLLLFRLRHALFSGLLALALTAIFRPQLAPPAALQTLAALRRNQTPAALFFIFLGFALCLPSALHNPRPLAFLSVLRYNAKRKR